MGRCMQLTPEAALAVLNQADGPEFAVKCFNMPVDEAKVELETLIHEGKVRVLPCARHVCQDDGTCTGRLLDPLPQEE